MKPLGTFIRVKCSEVEIGIGILSLGSLSLRACRQVR